MNLHKRIECLVDSSPFEFQLSLHHVSNRWVSVAECRQKQTHRHLLCEARTPSTRVFELV